MDGYHRQRKAIGRGDILLKYIVEVTCSETTDGSLFLFNKYCIFYGVKAA